MFFLEISKVEFDANFNVVYPSSESDSESSEDWTCLNGGKLVLQDVGSLTERFDYS